MLIGAGLVSITIALKPETDQEQIERISTAFLGKLVKQACEELNTAQSKQPQIKIQNLEQTGERALVSLQISSPGEIISTDLVLIRGQFEGWKVLGVSGISRKKESQAESIGNLATDSQPAPLDEALKTAFEDKSGTQVHRF